MFKINAFDESEMSLYNALECMVFALCSRFRHCETTYNPNPKCHQNQQLMVKVA